MTRAIGAACVSASRRVSIWREVARPRPPPPSQNLARCRASHRWVRWCAVPTHAEGAPGPAESTTPADEEHADRPSVPAALKPRKVLVIAGPTAVGKTRLSLSVARALGGEVVSADSVQVFEGLDVGSSKLPEAEREGIKHHLLDIADPRRDVGAGEFVEKAWAAMDDVLRRGKTPVVVGGTGMYLRWLIEGKPDTPPSSPEASALARATLRRVAGEAAAVAERAARDALRPDEGGDDEAATENARKQAMKTLHICACCYFKGNDKYLLPAKAFGIEQRTEYYSRCALPCEFIFSHLTETVCVWKFEQFILVETTQIS